MKFVNGSYQMKKMFTKLYVYILIITFIFMNIIKADLPVHCKREEIEGEWIFRINNDIFDLNLGDYRSTCGHGFPDKIEKLESDFNYIFDSFTDVSLLLSNNYKIYDSKTNQIKGKWTPVYDEGFIVNYDNSIFTAFMKYFLKPNVGLINKKAKIEDGYYSSNCQKTMIGWYVRDNRENSKNWSCFFGFKKSISDQFNYPSKNINKNHFFSSNLRNKENPQSQNNLSSNFPKKALKPNKYMSNFKYVFFNKLKMKYEEQSDIQNEDDLIDFNDMLKKDEKKVSKNFLKDYSTNSNDVKRLNNNIHKISFDIDVLDSLEDSFLEMKTYSKSSTSAKLKLENVKYEDQYELIREINNNDKLSWKADLHDDFKGYSFLDLKIKLGLRESIKDKIFEKESSKNISNSKFNNIKDKNSNIESNQHLSSKQKNSLNSSIREIQTKLKVNEANIFKDLNLASENQEQKREKDGEFVNSFEEISKYFKKELEEIDENQLPKNWDWRNIGGVNFVPQPRMQGNCGSCYVFSMITSLESRLRILTNNKDKTTFSRQFPISCNFYTEGCDGGYPILVAKFSSETELIPESCFEYKPETSKCTDVCDYTKLKNKYFVSRYEYLGGFYGNTNEIEIMKEIRARGPIPGNMSVPWSFSYYKSGIYSQKSLIKNSGNLNKTTMLDNHISWSSVDHSILLVGYGEENGTKYWIGMNTWGNNWGENGFFRILRGENDCNIETMGDAARVSFKIR